MHDQSKYRRGELVPMAVSAVVAVIGIVALFFMHLDSRNDVQRNGISMITSAVVYGAGATALPTDPNTQR
jgi:heme/copper-type cytochrome/quinol oxidase subunit 4